MYLQSIILKQQQKQPIGLLDPCSWMATLSPIWQLPMTSSQLTANDNPISIVTQSPKWLQTSKHKINNNQAHWCNQQIIWQCLLPNFTAVLSAYQSKNTFDTYLAQHQIDTMSKHGFLLTPIPPLMATPLKQWVLSLQSWKATHFENLPMKTLLINNILLNPCPFWPTTMQMIP